jgi:glucose/arabinose dehydrogenase
VRRIPGRNSLAAAAVAAALVAVPGAAGLRPAPVLELRPGFAADLYATGLKRPTALAFGPDGVLYATQEVGEVVAVGRGSTRPRVLARGFETPLGLAWRGSELYVSAQGAVHRLVVRGKRVVSRRIIVRGLPFGRHQQDTVAAGRDGRLYLGSGSTCDACRERDPRSGAILSFEPDGGDLRVVATGLRNPYGLAFRPGTSLLYASDNGRDDLGDAEPAETVVQVRRGADYGWPRCWASWRLRRLQGSCRGVIAPVAYLEPHSSANSLAFWRGSLYVAEWGQYLSERWGRKLVRVDLRTRRATTFATGFAHPLGLAAEPGGRGLLVGDWERGVVYRLTKR